MKTNEKNMKEMDLNELEEVAGGTDKEWMIGDKSDIFGKIFDFFFGD